MRPIILCLLALAACAPGGRDFSREGTWAPAGVNERNLRAMLADPSHGRRGIGAAEERGDAGAAPVTRLVEDKRKPLPPTTGQRAGGSQAPGGGNNAR
jgi:hypothetical protein